MHVEWKLESIGYRFARDIRNFLVGSKQMNLVKFGLFDLKSEETNVYNGKPYFRNSEKPFLVLH